MNSPLGSARRLSAWFVVTRWTNDQRKKVRINKKINKEDDVGGNEPLIQFFGGWKWNPVRSSSAASFSSSFVWNSL